MNIKHLVIALITSIAISTGVSAADYSNSTPAVQGYDVVSYQNGKRPVRGNGNFIAQYQKATYLFSSKENKATFEANPSRYVPAYGGYCAFGVSKGKKFVSDPLVWRVVDNKLYLNLDARIQDLWLADVDESIKTANSKWKKIKSKNPQSL